MTYYVQRALFSTTVMSTVQLIFQHLTYSDCSHVIHGQYSNSF